MLNSIILIALLLSIASLWAALNQTVGSRVKGFNSTPAYRIAAKAERGEKWDI